MGSYKDLKVWQLNQKCVLQAADLLNALPKDFAYQHVAKQLFRAISSIGANIAEGQDSHEGKEFIRYLSIAIRSAIEADHWLCILKNLSKDIGKINCLFDSNAEVIRMLKGLRKSIEEKR